MSWARAAGEVATTRLAWNTAAGSSSGTPAATIGQSAHRTTSVRTARHGVSPRLGAGRTSASGASSPTASSTTGGATTGAAGTTSPPGPGSQRSTRRGLGRLAPAAAGDPHLAGLQVAVAVVEPLPPGCG